MKKYIQPSISIIVNSQEILGPKFSDGIGEGEFTNQGSFEEEIIGDNNMISNLWDEE